jgi:hypothetical protein
MIFVVFLSAALLMNSILDVFLGTYIDGIDMVWLMTPFLIANALDCHSTTKFLGVGIQEGNPLVRFFISAFGNLWGPIIAKIALVPPVTFLLWKDNEKIPLVTLSIILAGVAAMNYCMYFRRKLEKPT